MVHSTIWLANLVVKLIPCILSVEDVIKSVYGNLKPFRLHPGGPLALFSFCFGCAASTNRKYDIRGLTLNVGPKKLALLVCNSYRIIVIECAVNIVKPRSIIAEWLEITCCSGGCTTPVKPRQPLSNYRILRV
jgi:hypothetical protein